jgi:pantothenate kinase-related protein Tda10
MFKKIITWLTKTTKIITICTGVYEGSYIVLNVVSNLCSIIAELNNERLNKYADILNTINKYLTTVHSAIGQVLSWFGADVAELDAKFSNTLNETDICAKSQRLTELTESMCSACTNKDLKN